MESYFIDTSAIQVTQWEFIIRLLVAMGAGFLIGFEREHYALTKGGEVFAGIRTFIFLTLLGFLGAALHFLLSPWIFAGVLFAVTVLTAISYWITANKGDIGGTNELTGILAVLIGGIIFLGHIQIGMVITVAMIVLLSAKLKFQEAVESISKEEMYDFIRFVVVALLIFPFLPNENYGPYEVFNPRSIGWVIILTSGLGLIGYILVRFLGSHTGILLTGILGGLLSSTAVTWVFSKKSKEHPVLSADCATAILAASSIMVIRVTIWVFVFNVQLISRLWLALGIVFLAAIGITLYFYRKHKDHSRIDTKIPPGKPLNLTGALLFGLIYTVILFIVAWANDVFGEGGLYIASSIAGLTDVDAITISVSKLSSVSISHVMAANAILIATIANTLVKIGIALWAGSKEMRKYILVGYGCIFIAAVVGFALMNLTT